jgi:hypothetical protein
MTSATITSPPTPPVWDSSGRPRKRSSRVAPRAGSASFRLSWIAAAFSVIASALTFFVDDVLSGPLVSRGKARGTALIVLVLVTPLMVASMIFTARGSVRALVVWLGSAGYLLYNSIMFLFATPFNRLFLFYVAMFSCSLWSVVALLVQTNVVAFGERVSIHLPAKGIAMYGWVVAALNAVVWMKSIVSNIGKPEPARFLAEAGLTTNPVFVQDLAVWLPLMALACYWMWQRRAWGDFIVGSVLVLWVLESIGVASDQWFGSAADSTTSYASRSMVAAFAAMAAIGLIPVFLYLRNIDHQR